MLEHPAVAEVAVLGVPDEALGEVITALVAAKQPEQQPASPSPPPAAAAAAAGAAAVAAAAVAEGGSAAPHAPVSEEELVRHCRERLAPYQVGERVGAGRGGL